MARHTTWKSLVDQADPSRNSPEVAYKFSGGRDFYNPKNPYASVAGGNYLIDSNGEYVLDSNGNRIEVSF